MERPPGRFVLDAVQLADEVDGGLRVGRFRVDEIAAQMRMAASTHTGRDVGDVVVVAVSVDEEKAVGASEHAPRRFAAAAKRRTTSRPPTSSSATKVHMKPFFGVPSPPSSMRMRVSSAMTTRRAFRRSSSAVAIGFSFDAAACSSSFIVERATGTPMRANSFSRR